MSVNSGKAIVKSSIPCGISTVLPAGSGLPKSGPVNDFALNLHRGPILPHENGEGLLGFAILCSSKLEWGAFH
jgi:hypothetical protein